MAGKRVRGRFADFNTTLFSPSFFIISSLSSTLPSYSVGLSHSPLPIQKQKQKRRHIGLNLHIRQHTLLRVQEGAKDNIFIYPSIC